MVSGALRSCRWVLILNIAAAVVGAVLGGGRAVVVGRSAWVLLLKAARRGWRGVRKERRLWTGSYADARKTRKGKLGGESHLHGAS